MPYRPSIVGVVAVGARDLFVQKFLCCLQDSDEAVERVLAVEVLHLLSAPGAYSGSISNTLGGSEVWQAYRHQKHDLFLPAGANRKVQANLGLPIAHVWYLLAS